MIGRASGFCASGVVPALAPEHRPTIDRDETNLPTCRSSFLNPDTKDGRGASQKPAMPAFRRGATERGEKMGTCFREC